MTKKRHFVAFRVDTSDGPRYAVRRYDDFHHTTPKVISVGETAYLARVSKAVLTEHIVTGFAGLEANILDISDWVREQQLMDNKARVARAKR